MKRAYLLTALMFLLGCTTEKPQVVEKKPRQTLEFIEELRFGGDSEEDAYRWVSPATTLSVDDQGSIFVADTKENRILQFSADGTYVKTVAKQGQGPGELLGLLSFDVIPGGAVAVDAPIGGIPALVFFDQSYQHSETTAPAEDNFITPANLRFSPQGQYAAGTFIDFDLETNQLKTIGGVIDRSFNVVKTFSIQKQAVPSPDVFAEPAKFQAYLADSLKAFFKEIGFFGFALDGSLYQAVSNTYQVTKLNADLSAEGTTVTRSYQPIPNSEAHLTAMADLIFEGVRSTPGMEDLLTPATARKIIDMAEPPAVKSPVFGLIAMEDGGFLVIHDINLASGLQTADIFDAQGEYLGQVTRPNAPFVSPSSHLFPRMIFRNDRAYTIETDADGNNWVVRYRYQLVSTE